MTDVEVRQWSDRLFAAYLVEDGDRFGVFVGSAATRPAALRLGRAVLRQRSENAGTQQDQGGVSTDLEHACVGESLAANKNRPGGRSDTSVAPGLTSDKGRLR